MRRSNRTTNSRLSGDDPARTIRLVGRGEHVEFIESATDARNFAILTVGHGFHR